MAALDQIVLAQPLFKGLETRLGALLAGCAESVHIESGEALFREDGPADEFYLITEGRIALEILEPGLQPAVFLTLGAGDMVGISWLVPPYRWTFDARALEPTTAIAVNARSLRESFETDHELGYELMKRVLTAVIRRLHATRLQMLDVYRSRGT